MEKRNDFCAVCYVIVLCYAVFFARRRTGLTERYINPVPVVGTVKAFLGLSAQQLTACREFWVNLSGNVALFLPLPFVLMGLLGMKKFIDVLLFSALFSLAIETIQFCFRRGVADADDVLLNTLGGSLGFLLYKKFREVADDVV